MLVWYDEGLNVVITDLYRAMTKEQSFASTSHDATGLINNHQLFNLRCQEIII